MRDPFDVIADTFKAVWGWLFDKDWKIKRLILEDWHKEHKVPKCCSTTGKKIRWKVTVHWTGKYDDETGDRTRGSWVVECEDTNWGDRPEPWLKYKYDHDKKEAFCGSPYR